MKKHIFFLIGIFSIFSISAQDYADDNAKYFDDGGISEARNAVKWNIGAMLTGDLSVLYERMFTDRFSVEAGVGVQLPFYVTDIGLWVETDLPLEKIAVSGGHDLWLSPKALISLGREDMGHAYMGLLFRKRKVKVDADFTMVFTDFSYIGGYQFFVGTKWLLDLGAGVGLRLLDLNEERFHIVSLPFVCKLGYIF